jgi:hypothetical protein
MIAELEGQLRERLGTLVFGVDDDTLEGAALKAVSERNWNLVAVESGLSGVLKRRLTNAQAPNLLAVEAAELAEADLSSHLKSVQEKYNAMAALGIAAFPESRSIELMLITPEKTTERQLTFGGHLGLLPRWAANVALNWLRRTAEDDS